MQMIDATCSQCGRKVRIAPDYTHGMSVPCPSCKREGILDTATKADPVIMERADFQAKFPDVEITFFRCPDWDRAFDAGQQAGLDQGKQGRVGIWTAVIAAVISAGLSALIVALVLYNPANAKADALRSELATIYEVARIDQRDDYAAERLQKLIEQSNLYWDVKSRAETAEKAQAETQDKFDAFLKEVYAKAAVDSTVDDAYDYLMARLEQLPPLPESDEDTSDDETADQQGDETADEQPKDDGPPAVDPNLLGESAPAGTSAPAGPSGASAPTPAGSSAPAPADASAPAPAPDSTPKVESVTVILTIADGGKNSVFSGAPPEWGMPVVAGRTAELLTVEWKVNGAPVGRANIDLPLTDGQRELVVTKI